MVQDLGVNTDGQFAEIEATEQVVRIADEKNTSGFLDSPLRSCPLPSRVMSRRSFELISRHIAQNT